MIKTLLTVLTLLIVTPAFAQDEIKSPQTEVEDALDYLAEIEHEEERRFTRFFSFYSVPKELLQSFLDALSFGIHSLSSEGAVVQPVKVTDTLYAVDIRDYGWTEEAWEKVSSLDPYFREPWIDYRSANTLRTYAGNAIVRGDWFLVHTFDNTRQLDIGLDFFLYYELLYARSKVPTNVQEFREAWGVDYFFGKKGQKIGNLEYRPGIVDQGFVIKSDAVSLSGLRQVVRVNGKTGYYWETYDAIRNDKEKNYNEVLFSTDRDGGEAIAQNFVGMQVYFIFDAEGNRAEFGDPSLVRNINDPHGDVRVRVPYSCIDCHGPGINDFDNEFLVRKSNKVKIKAKEFTKQDIHGFYFRDPQIVVGRDQEAFAHALAQINKLSPYENSTNFNRVLQWYEGAVTLEQAAIECGVTVEDFKKRVSWTISSDLANLLEGKGNIPRKIWENLKSNEGTFGHAMLLLNPIKQKPINLEVEVKPTKLVYYTNRKTAIYDRYKILGWIPNDTDVEILDTKDGWYRVEYNGVNGWVRKEYISEVEERQ